MDTDFLQADWLQELPEDLDMLIAQRNFEGAVDTVEKGEYFKKNSSWENPPTIVGVLDIS